MNYDQSGVDGAIFNENHKVAQGLRITAHKTACCARQAPYSYLAFVKSKKRDLFSSVGIAAAMMVAPSLLPSALTGGADIAWAGCDLQSGSTYLCSGSSAGDAITGNGLNITADSTYQVDSSVNGINALHLTSSGGEFALDLQAGSTITSEATGIIITGYGGNSGTSTITSAGNVASSGGRGIDVLNYHPHLTLTQAGGLISGVNDGIYTYLSSGTISATITTSGNVSGINGNGVYGKGWGADLTIDQSSGLIAGSTGIYTYNFGDSTAVKSDGFTAITAAGDVTGVNLGIVAENMGLTSGLTIVQTAGTISGGGGGIVAANNGNGQTVITVAGDILATNTSDQNYGDGIYAVSSSSLPASNPTDTIITQTAGTISGGSGGIHVQNSGVGATAITTAGDVIGIASWGIRVANGSQSKDVSITQTSGSITGGGYGIVLDEYGGGATKITTSGDVSGISQAGIAVRYYYDNYENPRTDLILNQTAGTISGGTDGISGFNSGIGITSISTAGNVIGTTGSGISASNWVTGTDLIVTQTAGAINGGVAGINASNVGTGNLTIEQTAGVITGSVDGIVSWNAGPGSTTITTTGDVSGSNGSGIRATNDQTTIIVGDEPPRNQISADLTITQTSGMISGGQDGIFASNRGIGTTTIGVNGSVNGGTGAAIQMLAANGSTININENAIVEAGSSGVAIRDGAVNAGTDTIGGDLVVNSAGIVTGDTYLNRGNDTFNLTGGKYTGDIYGGEGDDTFNWTGGIFVGGFYGQGGTNLINVSAAGYDGSQILDAGGTGAGDDGIIRTLNFTGITAEAKGVNLANWGVLNLDSATLSITDGHWQVGVPGNPATGVFLTKGSTLNGMAGLELAANLTIDSTSSFIGRGGGAGAYSILGHVTNAGTITMQDGAAAPANISAHTIAAQNGAAGDVVTIHGNYVGNGGTLALDTVLGDDASKTDMLVVKGDTSGKTNVIVNNVGGTGAQTSEGIKIIEVGGASNGEFVLVSDYTTTDGRSAVVGGAYAYTLNKNGKAIPTDGDWYLRSEPSTSSKPEEPDTQWYQAGAPVYEAYAQILLGLNGLPTLRQRTGNRLGSSVDGETAGGTGIWGRIEGTRNHMESGVSTTGVDYRQNILKLQAGFDSALLESDSGKLIGGITAHYTHGSAKTSSLFDTLNGGGRITTDGYGLGGTLTWHGVDGFYLDGQAQVTWYDSDLRYDGGDRSLAKDNKGFGYAVSLEGGKRFAVGSNWSLNPQAQLIYSHVAFDDFSGTIGAVQTRVSLEKGASLRGRLGVALDHEVAWQNSKGLTDRLHVYGIANLYNEFLSATRVNVADIPFTNRSNRLWGGLGVGGSYSWDNGRYSIYAEGTADTDMRHLGDSYSLKGQIGFSARL